MYDSKEQGSSKEMKKKAMSFAAHGLGYKRLGKAYQNSTNSTVTMIMIP